MKRKTNKWKIILSLILGVLLLTAAYLQISYVTFRDYETEDCVEYARGLTGLIARNILDPERIDEFLEKGRSDPEYNETERKLYELRDAYPDVVYLYVYQMREDGCHVVFDLDAQEFKGSEPGEVEEYFAAFKPYIPDLLAGKEVPTIISQEKYGHVLTVLTPLYGPDGLCKCYIGADFSMEMLKDYLRKIIREIIFFFLIAAAIILAAALYMTHRDVIQKMDQLEGRAYYDTLTGLQNRTAYYEYLAELNKKQAKGAADYSVLMIDINFLKRVNDTYGHEQGNIYLKTASDLIRKIFGKDAVYRIGGDEFVIVLEGKAQEGAEQRISEFMEETRKLQADESLKPWEKVSAAVGIARYEAGKDTSAEEVFRRADEEMYRNKVAMKAVRTV